MGVRLQEFRCGMYPVRLSLLLLLCYLGCGLLVSQLGCSAGVSVLLADAICCVWLFLCYRKFATAKQPAYHLSGMGWFLIGVLFLFLYVTSQGFGVYLQEQYASNFAAVYGELTTSYLDLGCYMAASVTVAPVAEELLFRGFCYGCMKKVYSRWVALGFSMLLFSLIHGTVAHLPIAMGLTVFLCVLYELTDRLWVCIVFHMLYNLFGVTLLIPVPVSGIWMGVWFILCFLVLLLWYRFVFVFRSRMEKGVFPNLTEWVQRKRDAYFDMLSKK